MGFLKSMNAPHSNTSIISAVVIYGRGKLGSNIAVSMDLCVYEILNTNCV